MPTIRELEIIKAALERDISEQRKYLGTIREEERFNEFKEWYDDSEKLLKNVSRKLFDKRVEEQTKL